MKRHGEIRRTVETGLLEGDQGHSMGWGVDRGEWKDVNKERGKDISFSKCLPARLSFPAQKLLSSR